MFKKHLKATSHFRDIIQVLCNATEYSELPVRHNEDNLNAEMAEELPWKVCFLFHPPFLQSFLCRLFALIEGEKKKKKKKKKPNSFTFDSPHTKAFLLLQAHFKGSPMPITDYLTDLKMVLDQAVRILQVNYLSLFLSFSMD